MQLSRHVAGAPAAAAGTARRSRPSVASRRPAVAVRAAINKEQLVAAYEELKTYINSRNCNPIIVRLAWHDSGTFDATSKEPWPLPGGANASIRFKPEIGHAANAGLQIGINLLNPIKKKYPAVSYADLFQMASAAAVEAAGGPRIDMLYGRKDVESPEQCAKEGFLPGAAAPFHDGSKSPADHLRKIFYRMGFNDQEIVALSGGHTLGRARPSRSGFGDEAGTKYTAKGPGTPGGTSWTVDWLKFTNSYFVEIKEKRDKDLLVLETDAVIFEDAGFRPYAEKYAADEKAFFHDYALAHKKLSELGVAWEQGGPVSIASALKPVGASA